jgi:hypothetical protein
VLIHARARLFSCCQASWPNCFASLLSLLSQSQFCWGFGLAMSPIQVLLSPVSPLKLFSVQLRLRRQWLQVLSEEQMMPWGLYNQWRSLRLGGYGCSVSQCRRVKRKTWSTSCTWRSLSLVGTGVWGDTRRLRGSFALFLVLFSAFGSPSCKAWFCRVFSLCHRKPACSGSREIL